MRPVMLASLALFLCLPIATGNNQSSSNQSSSTASAPAALLEDPSWVRCGGPLGGLGYDVRMSPSNPDLMFVTDAFAGVFRSEDGGLTWAPSNTGITTRTGSSADAIPVFSLTIDPNNHEVIWLGTQNASGIFRSVDEGQTWTSKINGLVEPGLTVRGFGVEPGNSDTVYAAAEISSFDWAGEIRLGREFDLTKGVVYKTTDGGENWTAVWRGDNLARYVWIDPRNVDVLYVSTGIFDREAANSDPLNDGVPGGVGIIKSTDGGATWTQVNNGLNNLYVGTLFMHPDDPDTLLAGTGNNQYGDNSGVYLSEDGGNSWTQTLAAGGDHSVEFSLLDPNIAYAADANAVFASTDGGRNWQRMTGGPLGWGPDGIRAGFPIDIQIDPRDTQRIFTNNYGGGNFLSEDGGQTWVDSSRGYTGAQVRGIAASPRLGGEVYAAARSGLFASLDGGLQWEGCNYRPFADLEWTAVAIDPSDHEHVLAASNFSGSILVTYDRGRNWERTVGAGAENHGWNRIAFAPSNPSIVYAGTASFLSAGQFDFAAPAGGVYVSTDGGRGWVAPSNTGFDNVTVRAVAIHPQDARTLFIAASNDGLLHSDDGAASWRQVSGALPASLPAISVAFREDDPTVVFAGYENGALYRSEDGGETWNLAASGMNPQATISDIVFDPTRPGTVYASDRRSGVLRSLDGGDSWTLLDENLTNRDINALALSPDGRHLYAATEGAGVFRLDVEGGAPEPVSHVTFMAQFGDGDGFTSDIVLTNPSTGLTPSVEVDLFDDDGLPIERLPSAAVVAGEAPAGSNGTPFSIAPLGSLVLSTEGTDEVVAGAAIVSSSSRLGGAIRFRIPGIGIAGVGESTPLSRFIVPVRYLPRVLSTGLAVQNPEPLAVSFTASLRDASGSLVSGPIHRSLPPLGHMAVFVHELFPDALSEVFQGTVEVTVEEGLVTATAIELGSTAGQFTTLPVTPIAEESSADPSTLHFAQFGNGEGLQCDVVMVNPSESNPVSAAISTFDDEGLPLDVTLVPDSGQVPAGEADWTIPPLGSLTLSSDGQGEIVVGSLRVDTTGGSLGGVIRYNIEGIGIAGVGTSRPHPGSIVPVRRTSGGINTGIAIHSPHEFPIQILLTLRDQSGQMAENGQATLEDFPANGHLAQFIDELFPNADTSAFSGTLTIQVEVGTATATALELGRTPGEFTTLPVTLFHGLLSDFEPGAPAAHQPAAAALPVAAKVSTRVPGAPAAPLLLRGRVIGERSEPVAGAVVRVQAGTESARTGPDGRFALELATGAGPVDVTASAEGYYIGMRESCRAGEPVEIRLHLHPREDNPDYSWLTSFGAGTGPDRGCGECHSSQGLNLPYSLPVDEWLLDAHSGSARNQRFLSMYAGTDVWGNRSPDREYGYRPDYGLFPLAPDPDQPYYGPGFRIDHPDQAGNCAACHTPAAAVNRPYQTDPRGLTGVASQGLPCDFCHKVWAVHLDSRTGLPINDRPGVLSIEFRRPPPGQQFFAGPFDDVAPGEDVYSPLQRESQFCAPCHYGVFWGVSIYNSFGEWLDSPYSDPETGQSCQDCHMPHTGAPFFARPDKGGLRRDPSDIFGHYMPGAADRELLEDALTLVSSARLGDGRLTVDVIVSNDTTGHHVPTGSPLRHVILVVQARAEDAQTLEQIEGPTIPPWGGVGTPGEGFYAGLPGEIYAKVLMEEWTEVMPAASYWNLTRLISDNRIAALERRQSRFVFEADSTQQAVVEVRLLFRRAFIELSEQKGWAVPDVVMARQQLRLDSGTREAPGIDVDEPARREPRRHP